MSGSIFDNPPTVEQVAACNDILIATDAEIVAIEQAMRALDARCQPLRDQLSALNANGPAAHVLDPAMVDALVADPTSVPDEKALVASVSAARKANDVWRLSVAAVTEAIARIDAEIDGVREARAKLRERRQSEWDVFGQTACQYLVATFRARFLEMRSMLIDPIYALSMQKNHLNQPLISHAAPRFEARSEIGLRWYEDVPSPSGKGKTSVHRQEMLFSEHGYSYADFAGVIERFRTSLPASDG